MVHFKSELELDDVDFMYNENVLGVEQNTILSTGNVHIKTNVDQFWKKAFSIFKSCEKENKSNFKKDAKCIYWVGQHPAVFEGCEKAPKS